MRLLPGQIWKDTDPRVDRHVLIQFVCRGDTRVRIKSCDKNGIHHKGDRAKQRWRDLATGLPMNMSAAERNSLFGSKAT